MTILASTDQPTERTLFVYMPPANYLGRPSKSFTLHKAASLTADVGIMTHLPVSKCEVKPEEPGYVLIEVPDWLVQLKKQFFNLQTVNS